MQISLQTEPLIAGNLIAGKVSQENKIEKLGITGTYLK